MRKLIVLSFISLDGVMQAPGAPDEDRSDGFNHGGWVVPFFDEALGEVMEEQMSHRADLLLGRKTFEIFASYWPDHAEEWPGINEVTKYVASNTLTTHEWTNSVILNGDAVDQVRKLKNGKGADIQVHGSGDLIQTLLRDDLVDELWLKIFPVTLGPGKRLFTDGSIPANFSLTTHNITPKGVITASYERDGAVQSGTFAG